MGVDFFSGAPALADALGCNGGAVRRRNSNMAMNLGVEKLNAIVIPGEPRAARRGQGDPGGKYRDGVSDLGPLPSHCFAMLAGDDSGVLASLNQMIDRAVAGAE